MNGTFWRSLRQLNTLVQLLVGLAGLAAIALSALKGWTLPPLPAWLGFFVVVSSLGFGFLLGRLGHRHAQGTAKATTPLLTVDYRDFFPLEAHGWQLVGDGVVRDDAIRQVRDRQFGQTVEIDLPPGAHLDMSLPERARCGRCLEFVGRLGTVYARVGASGVTNDHVWLRFSHGTGPPSPYKTGRAEWGFHVQPVGHRYGWPLYRIDLARAFADTFGRSGLNLVEVAEVRFRSQSVLAQLSIWRSVPAGPAMESTAPVSVA